MIQRESVEMLRGLLIFGESLRLLVKLPLLYLSSLIHHTMKHSILLCVTLKIYILGPDGSP